MRLHEYQAESLKFLLNRYRKESGSGLWLDCGLGKTIVTLSAIETLIDYGAVKRAIVVAPARVIATSWPKEIHQWGLNLSWAWLKGDQQEREAALAANPNILFISSENLSFRVLSEKAKKKRRYPQLIEWIEKIKFSADLLAVDEATYFKNWGASRTKSVKKLIRRVPNRFTLTGTPTPNSLGEIFPQQFILDNGETLSPHIGKFRDQYMRSCGYENRDWEIRPDRVEALQQKIAPWYLCQSALDHLDMPELVLNEIDVQLPPNAKKIYKSMQHEMFAELEQGYVVALSGSGKYNACRQIASGVIYDEDKDALPIHTAKLDALQGLYEELNGKSLLVAYWFTHEGELLAKRFPKAEIIRSGVSPQKTSEIIGRWKSGETSMILAQASTISHGVDGLQHGGNDLCWYTLTDNPDIHFQLNRRIYRQGATKQVRIHYLLAGSTLDRTILRGLNMKDANQRKVIQAVKEMGNG